MSRFYKVRIMHTEVHNAREVETFLIRPEMNIFDSFMTEICARLPELFYQPFKLYYIDVFGDFITIFNWLDFGIFFMQNILEVYIMKIDTKSNLHFRTIWSMPMPTARRSSAYEAFIQPAYQLTQQTCFDFLRSEPNQGQNSASAKVETQINNNASTEQQKTLIDFSTAATTTTKTNFSLNALLESIDMANAATNTDSNKVSSATANAPENPSATEKTTGNTEADFHKTANNPCGNDAFQNVNANNNISDILLTRESNKNILDGFQLHKKIAEDNKFEKLEVETPDDFNRIENECNNVKVPRRRYKSRKLRTKIEIVEPAQIIGESISEWKNETFTLGDIVEVCAGLHAGLIGKITDIKGERIKVVELLDGVENTKSLRFEAGKLCVYSKGNQDHAKIVSLDEKEPEVVQSNDNKNENLDATIDANNSDTLKEETIFDESSTKFTETKLCNYAKANQNEDKIISLDEEQPKPEAIQSNDNNNENVGTTIDAYKSDTLLEERIFDESSTQQPIVATLEAKYDDDLQKLIEDEPNILTKYLEDAIIQHRENTKGGSCDAVKLINIEDSESSIEVDVGENVISIESGQESPTSLEWTFVETAEYAETPVIVDTHVKAGTIPKKTISNEDINQDTVKRRILPEIPVSNVENITLPGHIAEALSIMITMGFSNNGDQLLRLLESVDGNIPSALDLVESQE